MEIFENTADCRSRVDGRKPSSVLEWMRSFSKIFEYVWTRIKKIRMNNYVEEEEATQRQGLQFQNSKGSSKALTTLALKWV